MSRSPFSPGLEEQIANNRYLPSAAHTWTSAPIHSQKTQQSTTGVLWTSPSTDDVTERHQFKTCGLSSMRSAIRSVSNALQEVLALHQILPGRPSSHRSTKQRTHPPSKFAMPSPFAPTHLPVSGNPSTQNSFQQFLDMTEGSIRGLPVSQDSRSKHAFERLLEKTGGNMSAARNRLLVAIAKERKVPGVPNAYIDAVTFGRARDLPSRASSLRPLELCEREVHKVQERLRGNASSSATRRTAPQSTRCSGLESGSGHRKHDLDDLFAKLAL